MATNTTRFCVGAVASPKWYHGFHLLGVHAVGGGMEMSTVFLDLIFSEHGGRSILQPGVLYPMTERCVGTLRITMSFGRQRRACCVSNIFRVNRALFILS